MRRIEGPLNMHANRILLGPIFLLFLMFYLDLFIFSNNSSPIAKLRIKQLGFWDIIYIPSCLERHQSYDLASVMRLIVFGFEICIVKSSTLFLSLFVCYLLYFASQSLLLSLLLWPSLFLLFCYHAACRSTINPLRASLERKIV